MQAATADEVPAETLESEREIFRAQADRVLYKAAIRRLVETQPNLTLFQQAVDDLTLDGDGADARVTGIVTQLDVEPGPGVDVSSCDAMLNRV